MSEKEPKRFEDWEEVDCNDCSRYWDNSCDGVKTSVKGSRKLCNSFLPTRSILIPEEIKRLKRTIKWLLWASALLVGCNVGFWILWAIWHTRG